MAGERLLLIDDDAELCQEVAEALRDEGFVVENTSDTSEGEKLVARGVFDVVILDYKMPGLNGIELLRMIKSKRPKTKVIITTGRPFIEKLLEEEGASHLVSGIVMKPFSYDELLEKIAKSLPLS